MKARKEVLESKVQHKNRASLASLVESVGDDQVELLGNVSGITEALQVLGLSEQEYQQMRAGELEGDHSSNGLCTPSCRVVKTALMLRPPGKKRSYELSIVTTQTTLAQLQTNERLEFTQMTTQALDQRLQTYSPNSDRYMAMTSRESTMQVSYVQVVSAKPMRRSLRSTRHGSTALHLQVQMNLWNLLIELWRRPLQG